MKKFNQIIICFFSLFLIIALYACGGLTSTSVSIEDRARIYSSSYTDVFKAVLAYCSSNGYAIQIIDKELGIIQTDYKSRGGIMKEGRIKLNFTLSKFDDNKTKVVLIARIEEQDKIGNWHADQSLSGAWEDVYAIIFKDIFERL
jgi:hypothetical protein